MPTVLRTVRGVDYPFPGYSRNLFEVRRVAASLSSSGAKPQILTPFRFTLYALAPEQEYAKGDVAKRQVVVSETAVSFPLDREMEGFLMRVGAHAHIERGITELLTCEI